MARQPKYGSTPPKRGRGTTSPPRVRLDDGDGKNGSKPAVGLFDRLHDAADAARVETQASIERAWRGTRAHPYILTLDLIRELCSLIEKGVPPETAVGIIGVSTRVFWRWKRLGQEYEDPACDTADLAADYLADRTEDDEPKGPPPETAVYAIFVQELRRATCRFLARCSIELANPKTPRDRARTLVDILRRRDRRNWTTIDSQNRTSVYVGGASWPGGDPGGE